MSPNIVLAFSVNGPKLNVLIPLYFSCEAILRGHRSDATGINPSLYYDFKCLCFEVLS
jgi:hypothetical protein